MGLRVTIEFDHSANPVTITSMAEQWLKHIVDEIKEKDHAAAEETARSEYEQRIIDGGAPVVWRSLADFLGKYVDDMKSDFHEDITLREGPLRFSFNQSGGQISISKQAFPYVQFTTSPAYKPSGDT